jgi:DnaJ-class molecular chaperone
MPVKGEGMPVKENASEFGDLFVEFVVDFPSQLTEEQKQTVRALLEK